MPEPDSLSGQSVSHYRVLEKLGGGGMGVVYQAEDIRLHRFVALKFLSAESARDPDSLARFRREAEAASALNHPNICTIYDVGEEHGLAFIAMEFLEGRTLTDCIKRKPMALAQVLDLSLQITDGLAVAHKMGIVHRDIKPANVLVTNEGRVKILDFGLAKLARRSTGNSTLIGEAAAATAQVKLTQPGTMMGTVAYMSPEQVRGEELDARTDIFSFGIVLYEMATGQQAFQGDTSGVVSEAILNRAPAPLRRLVAYDGLELDRIVSKALQKDRSLRYQTAAGLRTDLEDYRRELDLSRLSRAGVSRKLSNFIRKVRGATLGPPRPRWKQVGTAIAVLSVLGAAGGVYRHEAHGAILTDKDTVVLADFTNTTGDSIFDGTLRQALAAQLEQSPFLSLVSDQRIRQVLPLMNLGSDVRLTHEVSRQLCQRTGSRAVIEGSISQVGQKYLLRLRAINCGTEELFASTNAQARDRSHVLDALGGAAAGIRERLGESLASVKEFNTPLEQATTPSLEALQAYSQGWNLGNVPAAVPLFELAIRRDPNFAMAYASLGTIYYNLGETSKGAENVRRAYEMRQRLSEREKLYIESHYHAWVTGDLGKGRDVYDLWAQAYPRDWVPSNNLCVTYFNLGQYDNAFAQIQASLHVNPDGRLVRANVVNALLYLNRVEDAEATAQQALAKGLDSPFLRTLIYQIAFLQDHAPIMAQQLAWSVGKPAAEDVLLALEADTAAYFGKLGNARKLSGQAVASATQLEKKESAAVYEAQAAIREALFGNRAVARQRASEVLGLLTDRDVQYGATLALAFEADTPGAQGQVEKLASDLAKHFPEDTLVQLNYLPTIQALLALNRRNPADAISRLQAASPLELSTTAVHFNFVALYPVYVRAEAYLAARQWKAAAAEFQKILDHRGVVANLPIGALARLGLGRASAMTGDAAKARTAYQDFLALWKDADPAIPVLQQAKAEYAKLR